MDYFIGTSFGTITENHAGSKIWLRAKQIYLTCSVLSRNKLHVVVELCI